MPSDLPPVLAEFAASLRDAGFEVVADESGGMDCRALAFRRGALVIRAVKDRGVWSLDMTVDSWEKDLVLPVVHGALQRDEGDPEHYDPFAPRRDRDPAAGYDVPSAVRWLIRILLAADLSEISAPGARNHLDFRRAPVTVRVEPGPPGWSVRLGIDEGDDHQWLALPAFHGFDAG